MTLSIDIRRAIFGIGGGLFVFWLLQKTLLEKQNYAKQKEDEDSVPVPDDEDIQKAIIAYQSAVQAGESQQSLMSLNTDLAKEFGVRVYRRKTDGRFIATDMNGKELEV